MPRAVMAKMALAAAANAEAALSELLQVMEQGDASMEPATLARLLELAAATTKRLTAASTGGGDGPEGGGSAAVGARVATAASNDLSAALDALDALSLGGPASTHAPELPQAGEAAVAGEAAAAAVEVAEGDRVYFKAASGEAPRSGHVVAVHRELSYTLRSEAGELFERWPAASVKPPKVRSSP